MAKAKKDKKEKLSKLSKEEKKIKKEKKKGDKKNKDKKKEGKKNKKKDKKQKEGKKKKTEVKKTVIKPIKKAVSHKTGTPGRKRISSIVNATGADISLHHNAKIAVSRLRRLSTITGINNFIKGDTRGTVLKVAEIVIDRLRD
jgi:hypothetical protein